MDFNTFSSGVEQLPKKTKKPAEAIEFEPAAMPEMEETESYEELGPGVPAETYGEEMMESESDFTLSPDALCYRTADKQCGSCKYFEENEEAEGTCKILKIPVEHDAGCNAHENGASEAEGMIGNEQAELESA